MATPEVFVTAVTVAILAPVPGPVNVTVTPLTGLPPASLTVTTRGFAKAVLMVAAWPPPLVAVVDAGAPAALVMENVAGVATPVTVAFTTNEPAVLSAVKVGEVAMPEASVDTVTEAPPPAKLPLAPLAGAVNVTLAPLTGLPPESFTVATRGAAKAELTVAVWPPPLVAVIEAGGPTVLVAVKVVLKLATKADTVYGPPDTLLAVNVGEVAKPETSESTVTMFVPPANVPLGPLLGAKKVTDALATGLLDASRTIATKGAENTVLVRVLWPPPLTAAMDAAPGVIVAAVVAELKPGADAVIAVDPMLTPVN